MVKKKLIVTNVLGVHARPSSLIVSTATKFQSKITIENNGAVADAKSILSLLALAACHETVLELITVGVDEVQAADAIEEIFKNDFIDAY